MKNVLFAAGLAVVSASVGAGVWIEAENFGDRGGWSVDTQFVHKMGSAYLIAAGTAKTVADAVTKINIPEAGSYRVWVRDKDWVPGKGAGRFTIKVNGIESKDLGVSGLIGWRWESAGDFDLPAGEVPLTLCDKTGYFARCDAIYLTKEGDVPPDGGEALEQFRAKASGVSLDVSEGGEFDVVVVGAGTTGMAAAISAAREGAKTLIVNDRNVLGGNASKEMSINIHGAAIDHANAREGGVVEEVKLMKVALDHPRHGYSTAYAMQAAAEHNLTVALNGRVMKIEKSSPRRISAVLAKNTLTAKWTRYRGKIIIDCTGDGWIGYYAGVPWKFGREGADEYNEIEAPEKADCMTMSGLICGKGTVCWRSRDVDRPVKFETPEWAKMFPPGFKRKLDVSLSGYYGFHPNWWIEHGGEFNDFEDPELARDELIRISFAFWGWGKNEWEGKHLLTNKELEWVPFLDGRRETLRLMGDYVLNGNDQKAAKMFPDRISYGGWPMDTHDPLGIKNPDGDGYWRDHPRLPIYSIPYRILYSPAFDNFYFAGRCSSVTHMALGSVRVESTLATLGQACGTAAAMCLRYGLTPQEIGKLHIVELQQKLIRDGMYIPGIANEDPADFARVAKVSASSAQSRLYYRKDEKTSNSEAAQKLDGYTPHSDSSRPGWLFAEGAAPAAVVDGWQRVLCNEAHAWVSDATQKLPQWIQLDFPDPVKAKEVRIAFDSDFNRIKVKEIPDALAKDYLVEILPVGGEWKTIAGVKNNIRQLCVHGFGAIEISAVRVKVTATYGDPSARIFEIRVY